MIGLCWLGEKFIPKHWSIGYDQHIHQFDQGWTYHHEPKNNLDFKMGDFARWEREDYHLMREITTWLERKRTIA